MRAFNCSAVNQTVMIEIRSDRLQDMDENIFVYWYFKSEIVIKNIVKTTKRREEKVTTLAKVCAERKKASVPWRNIWLRPRSVTGQTTNLVMVMWYIIVSSEVSSTIHRSILEQVSTIHRSISEHLLGSREVRARDAMHLEFGENMRYHAISCQQRHEQLVIYK